MVCLTISQACSSGRHKLCLGGMSAGPGALGGWKCTCGCHTEKISEEAMNRQLRAVGINPDMLPKFPKIKIINKGGGKWEVETVNEKNEKE